ncbi:major facilitator superfamily domain-containing protein [Aspergillus floccosus]
MTELMDMEKSAEDCIHVEETKVRGDPLDNAAVARIYRKIDRRILPFVAVIYLLCYLDRSNIGNAKVLNEDTFDDLMESIQMTDSEYRVSGLPSSSVVPHWQGLLAVSAIAYGIGHMNMVGGLQAWRWLLTFVFDRGDKLNWHDAKNTLKEPRLWMHYIIYLCAEIGVSSLSLFSPSIVAGIGYTGLEAQLFVIPPYACAYVVTLAAAYMSDKYNSRGLVAAIFFLLGMLTFLIPACVPTPSLKLRYAMLVLSACGVFGSLPSLCAWVSDNVRNTTAASLASGLNVAFSGPGQIIGVWIYKDQQVPRYQLGHGVNCANTDVSARWLMS